MNGRWYCLRYWDSVSRVRWLSADLVGWRKKRSARRAAYCTRYVFLWVVMGLGFLASIMHLGSPMRAFNSLNRVGASGLSNEIAAGSIFSLSAVSGGWWPFWGKCQKRLVNSGC